MYQKTSRTFGICWLLGEDATSTSFAEGILRNDQNIQQSAKIIISQHVSFSVLLCLYQISKPEGGGFKYFLFSPLPGEMIQFGLRIFFKWVGEKPPTREPFSFSMGGFRKVTRNHPNQTQAKLLLPSGDGLLSSWSTSRLMRVA